jgi:hypothetical protein
VLVEAVAWAAHESCFTLDCEDLIAWLAREMNKTAVTRLMHVSLAGGGAHRRAAVERKPDEKRRFLVAGQVGRGKDARTSLRDGWASFAR